MVGDWEETAVGEAAKQDAVPRWKGRGKFRQVIADAFIKCDHLPLTHKRHALHAKLSFVQY